LTLRDEDPWPPILPGLGRIGWPKLKTGRSRVAGNVEIVRELYDAAEGRTLDTERVVSMFAEDGYMWDMASGTKFRGRAIGEAIAGLAEAFPDVHRELINLYSTKNVIIVELRIQGTHEGDLDLPSGILAPSGKSINVPCCDVFNLNESGRINSFHCYNEPSSMLNQLGYNSNGGLIS
jgi:hypothetical protein